MLKSDVKPKQTNKQTNKQMKDLDYSLDINKYNFDHKCVWYKTFLSINPHLSIQNLIGIYVRYMIRLKSTAIRN